MTYEQHQKSAGYRKLSHDLTREQYEKLTSGSCAYCGRETRGGIDRVDSKLGYSYDNCVSACQRCNARKANFENLGPAKAVDKTIELAYRNNIPPPSKREWRVLGFYRWVKQDP